MIDAISDNLNLGLKVDILDAKGNVINYTVKRSNRRKIKVTTPDGKVFYSNLVWETLRDVVLYAGILEYSN